VLGCREGLVFGRIARQAEAERAEEFRNGSEAEMNGQTREAEPAVSDNKANTVIDGTSKVNS
jgi:hypothetical protein